MKRAFLALAGLLAFHPALRAQSPITLGNAHMPSSGDTLRYTNVRGNSVSNYQATGENYYWDFGSVVSQNSEVRDFRPAMQTPYGFFFFNAFGEPMPGFVNNPLVSNAYVFYRKLNTANNNAFVIDGAGLTFSSIPLPAYYSDKDELYMFPLTYGKRDSTRFRFSTFTTTLLPIGYSKTGYRITRVDGWGVVNTPYGTEECLRLVTTEYSIDSLKTSFFSIPFPNNRRSYQWMTLNSKIPYFEVSGPLAGNNFSPNTYRYRGYPVDKTALSENTAGALRFYPNPVQEVLHLHDWDGRPGAITVWNTLGQIVLSQALNEDRIDVSSLKPGVYQVALLREGRWQTARLVKE